MAAPTCVFEATVTATLEDEDRLREWAHLRWLAHSALALPVGENPAQHDRAALMAWVVNELLAYHDTFTVEAVTVVRPGIPLAPRSVHSVQ